MKKQVNLQALRNSRNPKHNKIHDKIKRMKAKHFRTQEMTEDEVLEIASRYPQLEVRVVMGGDILIKSKSDTWMAKDEEYYLALYHKGMIISQGKFIERYHIQDVFYDLDFLLASIISHDDYTLGIRSRTNEEIQEIVESSK